MPNALIPADLWNSDVESSIFSSKTRPLLDSIQQSEPTPEPTPRPNPIGALADYVKDWLPRAAPQPEEQAQPSALGSLADYVKDWLPKPSANAPGSTVEGQQAPSTSGAASGAVSGPGGASTGLEAYARQKAAALGIDPDTAVRVANTEGGFENPVRQNQAGAPAYGPYQAFIGGPSNPGLGDEMLARGIDPRNPVHAQAAVDFALEHAAKNGWGAFQGAKAAGIGDFEGIGKAPAAVAQPSAQQAGAPRRYDPDTLVPDQIQEGLKAGLSYSDALAICGPVAALAFAKTSGRLPTLGEALELAKQVGWSPDVGMGRGSAGEIDLLAKLGVPARMGSVDPRSVAQTVSMGHPVIINSHGGPAGGHFWVASDYDQATGKFNFGNSAKVMRASGGQTWWRLQDLEKLGAGSPDEAIYMGGAA